MSRREGDRKGPRLYYDDEVASRPFLVEARVDEVDGWGPLRSPFSNTR